MASRKKDEADAIQHEIHQVEDMIRQLHERRVTLLRKLNSVQASTADLPPETLSLIFEYASLEEDGPTEPYSCPSTPSHVYSEIQDTYPIIVIGHVSSHWRWVSWSTPQLWNRMGIKVPMKADNISHILELHLHNSKALPCDLSLQFGPRDAIGAVLLNTFNEYSSKIRALQLIDPPPQWLSHISTRCPRLECLSVDMSESTLHQTLTLESASTLRHVYLRFTRTEVLLPWSSITHITLSYIPIDTCAKFLTRCPNLIYFSSEFAIDARAEFTPPADTITLHQLQTLIWDPDCDLRYSTILQHIRLPALRSLTWDSDRTADGQPNSHALLVDQQDTLLDLHLGYFRCWSLPEFRYAFSRCHHVQVLTLAQFNAECLYAALCALCPGWEGDEVAYLPYLESLFIIEDGEDLGHPSEEFHTNFCLRILNICRAKHTRPDFRFKLELWFLRVNWDPSVREELCQMVQGGFQLDIWEGRVRVGWLPQTTPISCM